jgi:hypothetical protein
MPRQTAGFVFYLHRSCRQFREQSTQTNVILRLSGDYLQKDNLQSLLSFFCLPKRKKQRKGQAKRNAPLVLPGSRTRALFEVVITL